MEHFTGRPTGYGEWQIGDESQIKLTAYHHGEAVELTEYEFDVLDAITDPRLNAFFREEHWSYWDQQILTLYIPKEADPWNKDGGYKIYQRSF